MRILCVMTILNSHALAMTTGTCVS